ncbi:MAG: hypothetical protein VXA08_02940 [Alphaproteobacteria bacterium]
MRTQLAALAEAALEILVHWSTQKLIDCIKRRTTCAELRIVLFRTLNAAPLMNRHLSRVVADDARIAYLLFFEKARLHDAKSRFALDGVARSVELLDGSTRCVLDDEKVSSIKYNDVLADRARIAEQIEGMPRDAAFADLCERQRLDDLPPGIPDEVHIFVSRCRGVLQGLHRLKEGRFGRCENRECKRLFFQPLHSELPTLCDDPIDRYWSMAGHMSVDDPGATQRLFCTHRCHHQVEAQLASAFSFCDRRRLVEASSWTLKKRGRARVDEALRCAVRRNEAAARELRALRSRAKLAPMRAVSEELLGASIARAVCQLNVDIGLLFAASKLASSEQLAHGKVLPGVCDNWRCNLIFMAKPVRDVNTLYRRTFRDCRVISNLLVLERYLEKLSDSALRIFT